MYELTENEIDFVVSQNVIPHKKYFGGASPYAFTETGVAMLSSILKSGIAIEVNFQGSLKNPGFAGLFLLKDIYFISIICYI